MLNLPSEAASAPDIDAGFPAKEGSLTKFRYHPAMSSGSEKLRHLLWCGTAGAAAIAFLMCYLSGLSLTRGSHTLVVAVALLAVGCVVVVPSRTGTNARSLLALEGLLLFMVMSTLGAVLSYLAMRHSSGYADTLLHRWDQSMGFSWPSVWSEVHRHGWLFSVLDSAYSACFVMPFILFAALWRTNEIERLHRFLLAYGLALVATVAIFFFLPARAAFAFYQAGAQLPENAQHYGGIISSLRDGSLTVLDLQDLGGIITFPSFHAAMAILFIWGVWPVRLLRVPIGSINALMWIAAVPIGGHYIVDVLAGSAIAGATILTSGYLACRAPAARLTISAEAVLEEQTA